MIKHIVFWRLYGEADGLDKQTSAEFFINELKSLPTKIDLIKSFSTGINIIDSKESSDIVLETTFDSIEDLNTYKNHPVHIAFIEKIKHLRYERRVVDYNF